MRKLSNPPDWHVIVFSFSGGERDGQSIRSDRSGDILEVVAYWTLTCKGTVGRQFDLSSRPHPSLQRYKVVSKRQQGAEIHVACEHVSIGGSGTDAVGSLHNAADAAHELRRNGVHPSV
jgi:hypothetical protein